MQRLYNDEISADMGRAATVAAGGTVAGLPAQRTGVGARRIPAGRVVDPGPRATARTGVGTGGIIVVTTLTGPKSIYNCSVAAITAAADGPASTAVSVTTF